MGALFFFVPFLLGRVAYSFYTLSMAKCFTRQNQPRIVLSGHSHAECITRVKGSNTLEMTVPAFSWRMRPDPGFGVVLLPGQKNGNLRARICHLPNEHTVFLRYAIAAFLGIFGSAWSCMGIWGPGKNGKFD